MTFALAALPARALAQETATSTPAAAAEDAGAPEAPPRGLSWSALTGLIPDSGGIIHGEVGFSGLPRVSYHQPLASGFSVGGSIAFDYARYRPREAFRSSVVLGVPIRYALPLGEGWDIGLRVMPGVRLPAAFGRDVAILVDVDLSAGFLVSDRLIVGGGVEMPISIDIGDSDRGLAGVALNWPILIGPIAEFHVTPPFAITLDAKIGPYLSTDDSVFALKSQLGIAYRF